MTEVVIGGAGSGMHSLRIPLTLSLTLFTGACVVPSLPAGELPPEGSGGTQSSDESDGPGGTGPGGTGPGMTTASSTTAPGNPTATGPGDGSSTTEGPLECPGSEPEGVACQDAGTSESSFEVIFDGKVGDVELEYAQTCTLDDRTDDGTVTTVVLSCEGGTTSVELLLTTINPHHMPELPVGEDVDLYYSSVLEDEIVYARHLTLRNSQGVLLLMGVDASQLDPPGAFDVSPLTLEVVPTDCAVTSTECVYKQNAALEVTYDGSRQVLFDFQEALVGQLVTYRLFTSNVERIHCFPRDCGYNYAEWFVQAMAFVMFEG